MIVYSRYFQGMIEMTMILVLRLDVLKSGDAGVYGKISCSIREAFSFLMFFFKNWFVVYCYVRFTGGISKKQSKWMGIVCWQEIWVEEAETLSFKFQQFMDWSANMIMDNSERTCKICETMWKCSWLNVFQCTNTCKINEECQCSQRKQSCFFVHGLIS